MVPVVPIYSSFYQRGYDQVIHDIAIQNLPVVMCVDRAGIVGADGETHQGLLDMAFFRLVPNLTIMAPKDFKELEEMLETRFSKEFPTRFFDIGIAEQHALGLAAGMAIEGMVPVVPIYSSFYQRGYDQVIHDIAIQNLPVVMCVDRAGIVGADGETHQGLLDMAFFRLVPNLTIMAPKDFKELEEMLELAVNLNKPVVIRYPRGGEDTYKFQESTNCEYTKIEEGKSEILKEGKDISIIAIGKMVSRAMKIAEELEKENISTDVINARFLKPLDKETIKKSIEKTKKVITIEDGTIINGLGTSIKELIIDENLQSVKLKCFAYPDKFIQHGSVHELEEIYGLDEVNIIATIKNKILN